MNLHENRTLFRQAVQITADRMGIATVYVEKDYWVTYALLSIFGSEVGKDAVFKGGTALSKCFNLIERFSEDIDLVVLRREGETSTQLKIKLKSMSTVLGEVLPEVEIEGITRKLGMNRKTAHSYDRNFEGKFGQVRDVIVLESSWLGNHEPFSTRNIVSYVGHMMLESGQEDLANQYELLPFEVSVLEPIRTICEKIMSMVRFSYGERPIDDLRNKVRHTYDLHQLLKQEDILEFFQSEAFDEMLIKVANDDVEGFRNNNKWLAYHPSESLFFDNLDVVWSEIKESYSGEFKNLVYGELPSEKDLLEFFQSEAFDEMLLKVGKDDVEGFRNNNKWLAYHPSESLFFDNLDVVWSEIKESYSGEFKNLVYGELPSEKDVYDTLKMIRERLETVSWTIKLDPEE